MKRTLIALFIVVLLAGTFATNPVAAQTTCGTTYTVVKGDYLNSIAKKCGTTASAILAVNPGITNWNIIYPGQVLKLPSGTTPSVVAGSVYIVKPGDTLSGIAALFKVTLSSLLTANPTITNANRIEKGQQIKLPAGAAQVRTVGITPVSGKAGDVITLGATGFKPSSEVDIRFGLTGTEGESIGKVTTDSHGAVLQKVTVPSTAQSGKVYLFVVRQTAATAEFATSNTFTVGTVTVDKNTYTVVSGDTLLKISNRFNTTVAAIIAANPKITNPNVIIPGQVLTIPANQAGAAVALIPYTGTAGSKIVVVVDGFPASQNVDVRLELQGTSTVVVVDGKTDTLGYLRIEVTLPTSAKAGEKWQVRVLTTDLIKVVEAVSGTFTVK
ncbi:MAG TPA: LysM peptidoglycan-binding domain-containing protein [Bellilinea sp.]